jgi:hypothetical protein
MLDRDPIRYSSIVLFNTLPFEDVFAVSFFMFEGTTIADSYQATGSISRAALLLMRRRC